MLSNGMMTRPPLQLACAWRRLPLKAFRDPFGVERIDDRENYGEERINLLGMCEGVILHATLYRAR